jgi:hypothetical protein
MSEIQTINYCTVSGCRFPQYHVTTGHKCGQCKAYGHGLIECGNPIKRNQLASSLGNVLPDTLQCKFGNCRYKQFHTSEGHHCSRCQERLHGLFTCPLNPNIIKKPILEIKCPICKQDNKINKNQQKIFGLTDTCAVCLENKVEVFFPKCGHVCVCSSCFKKLTGQDSIDVFDDIRDESILDNQGYQLDKIKSILHDYPSYTIVYEGMGCSTIIRRLNSKSPVEGLFNHSDDGYSPVKLNKLNAFIDGYCLIPNKNQDYLIHDWTGSQSINI